MNPNKKAYIAKQLDKYICHFKEPQIYDHTRICMMPLK